MRDACDAPQVRVVEADAFERPVSLRLPFRFGAATLHEARQAFARVAIEAGDGRSEVGWAADLMVPKWFDKRPGRSHEQNVMDLRRSVRSAIAAARGGSRPASLHAHSRQWRAAIGAGPDANALLAGFGPSLVERAAIDALGRLLSLSFPSLLREGALGFDMEDEPLGIDVAAFLGRVALPSRVALRHTVGLADPISDEEVVDAPDDDLPVSLAAILDRHAPRWLKIKLAGDADPDLARLRRIAALLDRRDADVGVTLDGNEQFGSVQAVLAFWDALTADPALCRVRRSVAYLEQPLARDVALEDDIRPLAMRVPVVIDESDDDDDAFLRARDRGYAGVSLKSCKGVFRALRNAIRCAAWNGGNPSGCPYFVTGEDLTAQAGLAVQQDLALAATLGVAHVERNGHHYATGMQGAPSAEQERFLASHPDLYERGRSGLQLRIESGSLALGSLECAGFASAVHPDVAAMTPIEGS